MKTSFIWTGAAILFALGGQPDRAYGCSCVQPESMKQALEGVDIAFRGTITGRASGLRRDAIFRVERVWKGQVSDRVRVEWKVEEGDCNGFHNDHLKVGSDLLVFAKRGTDGIYRTNICYPTKPASEAGSELAELGPGAAPKSTP